MRIKYSVEIYDDGGYGFNKDTLRMRLSANDGKFEAHAEQRINIEELLTVGIFDYAFEDLKRHLKAEIKKQASLV